MTKLPINFLLYLASLGLAGGSVYLFYEALVLKKTARKDARTLRAEVKSILERGGAREADFVQDRYGQRPEWWGALRDANFIGKLPPKPVEPEKPGETEQPQVDQGVRVADILTVVCILYDDAGSIVVVRYKPEANIKPPPELLAGASSYSGPGDAGAPASGPGARPGATGLPPGGAAMPAYSSGGGPFGKLLHHLRLEEGKDRLWPDYEYVRLVGVKPDASAAIFRLELPGKTEKDWRTEEVLRNELGLPEDYLRELYKERAERRGRESGAARDMSGKARAPRETRWKPVELTTIEEDRVYIGRKDHEFLAKNMQRVLQEDVGIRAYRGRKGRLRGLQVTRVPSELSRFGITAGDVILEVNGVPVRTKAQAIQAGKKQYRRGVRAFRVKILSRGVIQERTYYAPDK